MITNFVTDSFLQTIYPDIDSQRLPSQTDFSQIVSTAHELVIDDIENRGFDSRLCQVPIDLNRSSADEDLQYFKSLTLTASTNRSAFKGNREKRFVVNVTAKTVNTAWTFILHGSNESNEPAADSIYWIKVVELISNNADTIGQLTVKYSAKYKWYRLRAETSVISSVTFTACLYETIWDYLIMQMAMKLLFTSWSRQEGDTWDMRRGIAIDEYERLIDTIRINYDADEDGKPEASERNRIVGGQIGSISINA